MGKLFKVPGYVLLLVGGAWGLLVCLGIMRETLGGFGFIIGLLVFPFTVTLAPFYAALADGNWFPLILVYGSGIGATILVSIGRAIDKDDP